MLTLALLLSSIQSAHACAMPRYEPPPVAVAEAPSKPEAGGKETAKKAPATLADALADIDAAGAAPAPVIPEVQAAPVSPEAARNRAAVQSPALSSAPPASAPST